MVEAKINRSRMLSIMTAVLLLGTTLMIVPLVKADSNVIFSVLPSSQTIKVGQNFTLSIYCDPNGNALDSLSTDYLWWDYGMMKLKSIVLNQAFVPDTPVAIGEGNYTPWSSGIASGETKESNYSLPYSLNNCNTNLTYVKIPATATRNYTMWINGQQIVNISTNQAKTYNLSNWTDAGAITNVPYLNLTIKNWGTGSIAAPSIYMQDSNKRFLGLSRIGSDYATDPGYFANLTFEALNEGVCNFHIGLAQAAADGLPFGVETNNASVTLNFGSGPVISGITPANNSINVNPIPTVGATANDPDGDLMDIWINVTNSDGGATYDHWSGVGNGTQTIGSNSVYIVTYGKTYNWTIQAFDGHYWNNKSLQFTLRGEYYPNEPDNFNGVGISTSTIDLTWTKGSMADKTYIMAKQNSIPADRTDGTNIYNGTGTATSHNGLSSNQHWYYAAWSFNNTDGTWSNLSETTNAWTLNNTSPTIGTPSPTNGSTGQARTLTWSVPISDADGDTFNWTIQCSNGQSNSANGAANGTKSLALTGLAYSTTYTVYVNATDLGSGQWTRQWFTFTTVTNQAPTVTAINPTNGSTGISLKPDVYATISDPEGDSMNIWLNVTNGDSGPTGDSWTGHFNGTVHIAVGNQNTLNTYSKQYNWTLTIYDGINWVHEWYNFTTVANQPPTFGSPTIANGSSGQPILLTWSIAINDFEGDLFNWTIQCSNGQSNSANSAANGTKILAITNALDFSTIYVIWVNATDVGSGQWIKKWFTFATVTFTVPSAFSGIAQNRFNVGLTWTKGTSADATWIERNSVSSWSKGAGDFVYNGTGSSTTSPGLYPGTLYYYRAWSWNATAGFTATSSLINVTTLANQLPVITDIRPLNDSGNISLSLDYVYINVSDPDGDLFSWSIFGDNLTTASGTNATNGTFLANRFSLFPIDTTITWHAAIHDGYNWTNATYTFKTGQVINVTHDLIYLNETRTGYNFISLITLYENASVIGETLTTHNVSWEYVCYWDSITQTYANAFYNGSGGTDHNFSAGDAMIISVLENTTISNDIGFNPTMTWTNISMKQGTNWLGRTAVTTTAFKLGQNLTAFNVNWTQILFWNATAQNWSAAFTVGMLEGSTYNFNIAAGDAVLVATNATGVFKMFGW